MGREREGKGGEGVCISENNVQFDILWQRGKGEGGVWREEDNRWMDDAVHGMFIYERGFGCNG